MSDDVEYSLTANYQLKKPFPGLDEDIWGGHVNENTDAIDNLIFTNLQALQGVFIRRDGDTLTEGGTIGGVPTPTASDQIAPKAYVDGVVAALATTSGNTYLAKTGGALTSGTISNIPTPVAASEATPKSYVDAFVSTAVKVVGSWNASTNTPTLASGNGTPVSGAVGSGFIVDTAGATVIDGAGPWFVGDLIIWNASNKWSRVPYGSVYAMANNGTLTGPTITGAVQVGLASGYTLGALDPRLTDTVLAIQDANGNIVARIRPDGTAEWSILNANTVTAQAATMASLTVTGTATFPAPFVVPAITIAGDVYEAGDPRIPGMSFVLRDTSGNIAVALDSSGILNTGPLSASGPLTLKADPTANLQAATKQYVDNKTPAGGPFLPTSGGTLSGPLILSGDPTVSTHASNKNYVDMMVGSSGGGLDPSLFALLAGPVFTEAPDVNDPGGYNGYKIEGQPVFSVPLASTLGRMTLIGWQAGYGIQDSAGGSTICIGFGSGGGAGAVGGGPGMTGAENTYVGWRSGAFCTTGNFNAAFGVNTIGKDNVGANLTALGNDAMRNPVGGNQATAVGSAAARDYVMIQSVALGNSAMRGKADAGTSATTGSVAIGSQAMRGDNAVTPNYNTAVGFSTLQFITTGTNNATLGYLAGQQVTSGSGNILVGTDAGKLLTTGTYNTLIGPGIGSSLTTGSGNLHLAAGNATVAPGSSGESNTFRLGGHATNLMRATNINTATPQFFLDWFASSPSFANDAAAAAGGVGLNQVYRNGSAMACRAS